MRPLAFFGLIILSLSTITALSKYEFGNSGIFTSMSDRDLMSTSTTTGESMSEFRSFYYIFINSMGGFKKACEHRRALLST